MFTVSRSFSASLRLCGSVALCVLAGCTTEAAKKAMGKPMKTDKYTGFDSEKNSPSKREADKPKPVATDVKPEEAVEKLIAQLQRDRASALSAEEQLKWWGMKQGVDRILINKLHFLLLNQDLFVRAPALRLTILYGGPETNGDLIEALGDVEYGMRETAYKALKTRTKLDFGFSPSGGEVARAESINEWRRWWQSEQQRIAVQPPSVYEKKGGRDSEVVRPKK